MIGIPPPMTLLYSPVPPPIAPGILVYFRWAPQRGGIVQRVDGDRVWVATPDLGSIETRLDALRVARSVYIQD